MSLVTYPISAGRARLTTAKIYQQYFQRLDIKVTCTITTFNLACMAKYLLTEVHVVIFFIHFDFKKIHSSALNSTHA